MIEPLPRLSSITLLLIAAAGLCLGHQPSPPPERKASAHSLSSPENPKVEIKFAPTINHVGGERFVLYGVADCEIHVFVAADTQRRVKRLFWVHFEGYLPERKHSSYQYDS